jgi:CBS domain-containing protein
MLVKDVMNANVLTVKPDIAVKEAATIMYKNHIGSLIVLEKEKIIGIITEGDVLKTVARDLDLNVTLVSEVMTKDVISIEPNKTIEEAVNLMTEKKIKKLPVIKDGELMGIITASDIIVVEPKLIENIANLISIKIPGYRGG